MGLDPVHPANAEWCAGATVALNAAQNAGILAAQILGSNNPELQVVIAAFKEGLKNKVINSLSETTKTDFKFQVRS